MQERMKRGAKKKKKGETRKNKEGNNMIRRRKRKTKMENDIIIPYLPGETDHLWGNCGHLLRDDHSLHFNLSGKTKWLTRIYK